jgi:hypothetical protein
MFWLCGQTFVIESRDQNVVMDFVTGLYDQNVVMDFVTGLYDQNDVTVQQQCDVM